MSGATIISCFFDLSGRKVKFKYFDNRLNQNDYRSESHDKIFFTNINRNKWLSTNLNLRKVKSFWASISRTPDLALMASSCISPAYCTVVLLSRVVLIGIPGRKSCLILKRQIYCTVVLLSRVVLIGIPGRKSCFNS